MPLGPAGGLPFITPLLYVYPLVQFGDYDLDNADSYTDDIMRLLTMMMILMMIMMTTMMMVTMMMVMVVVVIIIIVSVCFSYTLI